MTIDKLIRDIDTIVEKSGLIFENHKILKPKILEDVKYLFFIDEFYENMLTCRHICAIIKT